MDIIKKTSTHNTTAAKGRTIKYLAIHYTAGVTSRQGSARNTASWFMNPASKGSADFIVDDVEIVQYNPDPNSRYCWAVGDKKYTNHKGGSLYGIAKNSNTISIEICSSSKDGKVHDGNDSRWYFTDAAVDRAVELAKYLMKMYNIPAERVVRHFDISGKWCPGIIGWNADSGDESKWRSFKARIGNGGSVSVNTGNTGSSTLLKKGSRGDAVKTMQTMLNAIGYSCGAADGIIGNKTLNALKSFQKDHGLTVDGIYGEKSAAALKNAYQSGAGAKNLRIGDRGEAVRTLQAMLNACGYNAGAEDSIFGKRTLSALKAFQSDHGLTVDGIYGKYSRAELERAYQSTH